MADPTTPLGPRQGKASPTAKTHPENPLLEQPNFGFRSEAPHQTYLSAVNTNPFAALEMINSEEEDPKHSQEETGVRWVFQVNRKQAPRLISPGKAPPPSLQPTPQRKIAHQEAEERELAQRYITLSLPLWVSLYPQEKNSPEQKSGQFCPGKETTRRRF
jgi:hypothetical protein